MQEVIVNIFEAFGLSIPFVSMCILGLIAFCLIFR